MSCARIAAALLLGAAASLAGGINTDAAIIAGEGQVVTRVKLRYQDVDDVIDRFIAQQTLLYGVHHKLTALATFGYVWNDPGADGFTDVLVRGRYKLFGRDAKRQTLTVSALFGYEIPVGEAPIGSPDGGYRLGAVATWEKSGWRVDADAENAWRPNAPDFRRVDVALIRNVGETDAVLWQAVLELNYSRTGRADVLFLSPGLVYEIAGWKFEVSLQVQVAEDSVGPAPDYSAVFSVVHVF